MIGKSANRYCNQDNNKQIYQLQQLGIKKSNGGSQQVSKSHQFQQKQPKKQYSHSVQIPKKSRKNDIIFFRLPKSLTKSNRQILNIKQNKSLQHNDCMIKFRRNLQSIKNRCKFDKANKIQNSNRYKRFQTDFTAVNKKLYSNIKDIKINKKIHGKYLNKKIRKQHQVQQFFDEDSNQHFYLPNNSNLIGIKKKLSLPISLKIQQSLINNQKQSETNKDQNNIVLQEQSSLNVLKQRIMKPLTLINLYSTQYLKQSNLIIKNHIYKTSYPNRNKIINLPDEQNIHTFLDVYEPISKKFNLKQLKFHPFFLIKKFTDQPIKKIYFGIIKDGLPNEIGVQVSSYQIKEGQWKNGHLIKGVVKDQFQIYEGELENSLKNGLGQSNFSDGSYFYGQWKNNLRHGKGYLAYHSGISYFGDWLQGNFSGEGVLSTLNSTYEGEFSKSMRSGFGKQIFQNGDQYEGFYEYDLPSKFGKYFWKQGSKYVGEFNQGYRSGKGKLISLGILSYTGSFQLDLPHGDGSIIFNNGDEYCGQFEQGKIDGYGNLSSKNQNKILQGIWMNNKLIGFKQK